MSKLPADEPEPPQRDSRRYPIGAEIIGDAASFRLWAPSRTGVELLLEDGRALQMRSEANGYFRLDVQGLPADTRYKFRLEGIDAPAPDPASRFQFEGPDGWSSIVDPFKYRWQDLAWKGLGPHEQILYEIHMGTFTPAGTYRAAMEKLPALQDIGVTCLEIMPLNEFRGNFGWGYDGILPFAPSHLYGEPDDLRALIDAAHACGIGVILDVVYNHFGVGDRYRDFSADYFTDRYSNDWGSSINFDGPGSAGVREFVSANARYWIDEFHFDGLRLDATQALNDASHEHIIAAVAREARSGAGDRAVYLVAENEPQESRLVRPASAGGYDIDALWNDDFHHSAMVALTGRREAYYHDHSGTAQEFVSAAKYGYLFQGQRYDWQKASRGQPAIGLPATSFIHFLQNHDQIANSGTGGRLHQLGSPARARALTALLLLGPQTPLLFQGQEFGASTPFHYFADHPDDLAREVRQGRVAFLRQFPSLANPAFAERMPEPSAKATFEACKLDWSECESNCQFVELHRDLIALRRACRAITHCAQGQVDGSVMTRSMFLLRYFADEPDDQRLLIVNLGSDAALTTNADPLLAPPAGRQWTLEWSSEDFGYGGSGVRPVDMHSRMTISANCALFFRPENKERLPIPDHDELLSWQEAIGRGR